MTIIAWDGETLAADKQSTFANMRVTATKINRMPNGSLFAASGETSMCKALRYWYENGADLDKWPDKDKACSVLVIEKGPRILYYDAGPHPVEIEERFCAMGSGRDYAIAAMYLGHSAREAVALASHFDASCGRGIDELKLDEAPA